MVYNGTLDITIPIRYHYHAKYHYLTTRCPNFDIPILSPFSKPPYFSSRMSLNHTLSQFRPVELLRGCPRQEEVVHVPKVMTATRQVQQPVEQVVEVPIHQRTRQTDRAPKNGTLGGTGVG